jgi:hypothetical protein
MVGERPRAGREVRPAVRQKVVHGRGDRQRRAGELCRVRVEPLSEERAVSRENEITRLQKLSPREHGSDPSRRLTRPGEHQHPVCTFVRCLAPRKIKKALPVGQERRPVDPKNSAGRIGANDDLGFAAVGGDPVDRVPLHVGEQDLSARAPGSRTAESSPGNLGDRHGRAAGNRHSCEPLAREEGD